MKHIPLDIDDNGQVKGVGNKRTLEEFFNDDDAVIRNHGGAFLSIERANEILSEWAAKQPKVYGSLDDTRIWTRSLTGWDDRENTHQARLIDVKPLEGK